MPSTEEFLNERNSSEVQIDLNSELIKNPGTTYFFRMNSSALQLSGILQGDILIADKSVRPANGDIVLAWIGNELIARRLQMQDGIIILTAESDSFKSIQLQNASDYRPWGTVTAVVRVTKRFHNG